MKRETIESLIPETVENRAAVIDKIMTEAGKDITREQKKFEDYDDIKEQLTKAQATIAELEKVKGSADELQKQIDAYKTAEAERVANEAKTAKQREAAQRFATAKGQHEFLDPDIEEAVMNKFMAAVDDPANKGKGDAEIYTTLTKDKPFFKSMNPDVNMGGVGDVSAVGAITPEQFAKMGMRERSELAAKDPKQYDLLSKRSK